MMEFFEYECPNCLATVLVNVETPVYCGPGKGNEAWKCDLCTQVMCIHCYVSHNEKHGLYDLKKTKTKKKKK
jgi:hypothetical protein